MALQSTLLLPLLALALLSLLCTTLTDAQEPPVVLWYAPFLSGGGYCSEAHSYVTSIATALQTANDDTQMQAAGEPSSADDALSSPVPHDIDASAIDTAATTNAQTHGSPFSLYVTQHGDSLNAAFIRDIPDAMRSLLQEHWIDPQDFYWSLAQQQIAIAICHSEPGAWHPAHYATSQCPPPGARFTVGRTMFETDRVPSGWADRMNALDEIWVPTRFQERVFIDGGVRAASIRVVPEAVDVQFFDPSRVSTPYDFANVLVDHDVTAHTTVFLSIFKWEERKAWRVLLQAYWEAFDRTRDDVLLVLLTNSYHADADDASDFVESIERFALAALHKPLVDLPRLLVLPPQLPQAELPALYAAATAFVLPSRGEGWGRPHVEAMAMALPVIATNWSGTTEYMTDANSYPLRIDGLVEIKDGAFRGHKWAEPSLVHLKELLVHVRTHPEEAAAKGQRARQDMVAKYAPDVIGALLLGHIDRILHHVARQQDDDDSSNTLADTRDEL